MIASAGGGGGAQNSSAAAQEMVLRAKCIDTNHTEFRRSQEEKARLQIYPALSTDKQHFEPLNLTHCISRPDPSSQYVISLSLEKYYESRQPQWGLVAVGGSGVGSD